MQKTFKKLRSSALLIAMVIGVVISATLFGLVAATNQYLKSSSQSRDGKRAYQAAISGIDDGLLRYKYAISKDRAESIMRRFDMETVGVFDKFKISSDAYYNLSIRSDSVSVGKTGSGWLSDADKALAQDAIPLLTDDAMEIDLAYSIKELGLNSVELAFSNPFVKSANSYIATGDISNYFSALNFQVINYSAKGEQQIVLEDINKVPSKYNLTFTIPAQCMTATSSCSLRITPRIVKKTAISDISNNRLDGSQSPINQKYVFLKIFTKNNAGNVIEPLAYKPGTLIIESIGVSGEAKRKLQAQIDLANGKYLGMFDFGVYCGDKCVMP